jgi:acetyltransferase-like isoleucine patch superfamily enzyme
MKNLDHLHAWVLRRRGFDIGVKSQVSWHAKIQGNVRLGISCRVSEFAFLIAYGGNIRIGDNCSVNPFCVLYGHGGLTIGNRVRIAAHTVIIPANHGIDGGRPIFHQKLTTLGITIEDDVWIGAGARILDGVRIAQGSVIGAGAVVTKSTEPYGIYVGVPARKMGSRPNSPGAPVESQ